MFCIVSFTMCLLLYNHRLCCYCRRLSIGGVYSIECSCFYFVWYYNCECIHVDLIDKQQMEQPVRQYCMHVLIFSSMWYFDLHHKWATKMLIFLIPTLQ